MIEVKLSEAQLIEQGLCLVGEAGVLLEPVHAGEPFERMKGAEQPIDLIEVAATGLLLAFDREKGAICIFQNILCFRKKLFYGPVFFHRMGLLQTLKPGFGAGDNQKHPAGNPHSNPPFRQSTAPCSRAASTINRRLFPRDYVLDQRYERFLLKRFFNIA